MGREITLTIPSDGGDGGFRVGDKFKFKDPLNSATITEIHKLTPKEEAENKKRAEMREKEDEHWLTHCPECGQHIG